MTTWTEHAEALEAACMAAANSATSLHEMNAAMDRIVWGKWFAWYPVRTMVQFTSKTDPGAVEIKWGKYRGMYTLPRKWVWLRYVKRHRLDPEKFMEY